MELSNNDALINKFNETIFQYIDGFETEEGLILDGTLDEMITAIDCERLVERVKDGETIQDITTEMIDEYIQISFNAAGVTNFYDWINELSDYGVLEEQYKISEFVILLSLCYSWFSVDHNTSMKLDSEKDIWNSIAFWFVKERCYETIHNRLKDYLAEMVNKEIEKQKNKTIYKGESRLECVVCLEKKIIYTGCSKCNSAFCCFECYEKLDNVCPLCRHSKMINCVKCDNVIARRRLSTILRELCNTATTPQDQEEHTA